MIQLTKAYHLITGFPWRVKPFTAPMLPVPRVHEDTSSSDLSEAPASIVGDDINSQKEVLPHSQRHYNPNILVTEVKPHTTLPPQHRVLSESLSPTPDLKGRPVPDAKFERPLAPASASLPRKQHTTVPDRASMMTTFSTRIAPSPSPSNPKALSGSKISGPQVGTPSKIIFEASAFGKPGESSSQQPGKSFIYPWPTTPTPGPLLGAGTTAATSSSVTSPNNQQITSGSEANKSQAPSMASPQTRPPGKGKGRPGIKRRPHSNKRKREDDSETEIIKSKDSSFSGSDSEEYNPQDIQTKSGRQIHRPTQFIPPESPQSAKQVKNEHKPKKKFVPASARGRDQNILCEHCLRGNGPLGNVIVFCDGCNRAWHQNCHEPRIQKEVVVNTEKDWFCTDCNTATSHAPAAKKKGRPRKDAIPGAFAKATTPQTPGSVQPSMTAGKQVKVAEQKKYLYSLSKEQLVQRFLHLAAQHPELPLFPGPQQVAMPSNTPQTSTKNSLGTGSTVNTPKASSERATATPGRESTEESDDEYIYDEHALLYPRAGHGIQLPPENEDLHMLLEGPDCKTFSHELRPEIEPFGSRVKAGREVGVFG